MAVTAVNQKGDTPSGKVSTDDLGARSYVREFYVTVTDLADGLAVVTNAPGIPRLFTPYVFAGERDDYALCRSIDARRLLSNGYVWLVRCEYRTFNRSELQLQYENPLVQLPDIDLTTEKYQEVVYAVVDEEGNAAPCRSSAGQVFDPPPMRDRSRLVLTITRNEDITTPHPSEYIQYQDVLNADVFWGSPPGVWKCQGVTAKREIKQLHSLVLFPYLRVTYRFEARVTWQAKLLDAGTFYLAEDGRKLFFPTGDGYPASGLLDGQGGRLEPNEAPVFLLFDIYEKLPFAPLTLPQSFLFGA